MARPRPTPLDEGSIQNIAREEIRFRSSVPVLTETDKSAKKKTAVVESSSTQAKIAEPFQHQCLHRR